MKVQVKWQKNNYDVEIDASQSPLIFKQQLFSLTGVPADRQKIMVKGGVLKDDADWKKLAIKDGAKLMMMGSAEQLPEAPKTAQVFLEDLPEDEQDVTGLAKYGAGLENLGNTCYMNSTVQCLYSVPELRSALQSYGAGGQAAGTDQTAHRLTVAAQGLFADLQRSATPVHPFRFLLMLRERFPQFAQRGRMGEYSQQDAEECWTQLLYTLRGQLKEGPAADNEVMQRLFGIGLHTPLVNAETQDRIEEDTTAFTLKCNINLEVNTLEEGIKLGLKDDREKHSEALGRTVAYLGSSVLTRLPPCLTVQMVRFFYKADVQQKAKILRKVVFPATLDMHSFCSEGLQKELEGPRRARQDADDAKAGLERAAKKAKQEEDDKKDAAKAVALKGGKKAPAAASAAAPAAPASQPAQEPASAPAAAQPPAAAGDAQEGGAPAAAEANGDVEMHDAGDASGSGSSQQWKGKPTGRYELCAVLTHKGRSADSGHYVSWVKQQDGSWVQFDDEQLLPRKEEDVLALSGGGDWHMAYLLLYRAQLA